MAINNQKNIDQVILDIAADAEIPDEKKKMLIENIRLCIPKSLDDKFLFRLVVLVLGIVAIGTLAGGIASHLTAQDKEFPAALVSIGSAALGALAGLLTPYTRQS